MARKKRPQQRPGLADNQRKPKGQPEVDAAGTVPRSTGGPASPSATTRATRSAIPVTRQTLRTRETTDTDAMRQRIQARRSQRRPTPRRAWYQGRTPLVLAVVGVVVIIGILFAIANRQNTSTAHAAVPANVLNAVEHPSTDILGKVGAGSSYLAGQAPFKALPANTSGTGLPPVNGKPVLLYIGGEYCPFCAANRWALVMALSRFGTFTGLKTNSSSASDVYPATPTFTFVDATYTSPYLVFDAKEIAGASPTTPLQTLTPAEQAVIQKYDDANQSIPFINFGGQYASIGASYDAGVLHTTPSDPNSSALSYDQIVSALQDANNPITQAIVGTANEYTAAICKMTNNADQAVCSNSTIAQLESKLPQR